MTEAARIVALDAARGELWVTLEWPDGSRLDRPIADVETAQLVDVMRRGELPRVVADSVAARMPRTLGGAWSAVEELLDDGGPVGLNAPIGDREHRDLIDELKAAGRSKVAEWTQELGRLALRAQDQRDEWLRLHNDPAPMPADVRVELAVRGGEADSRAQRLLMVRDWLYEVAPLVDYDTADVTDQRGFAPVGAFQALAVPAAIVTILAGFTLAGWIVREGRLERQHAAELEVFRETRDRLATCTTEQECAAFRQALNAAGQVFDDDDDDGLGWGWYAAGAAVVIGLAWSRRAQLGEAAEAVARRVRRG